MATINNIQNKPNNLLTRDYITNNYGFALLHLLYLNDELIWSVLELIPVEYKQVYFSNREETYNIKDNRKFKYKCFIVDKDLILKNLSNIYEHHEKLLPELLYSIHEDVKEINLTKSSKTIELYDIWYCDKKIVFQSSNWGVVRLLKFNIDNSSNINISEEDNFILKKELGIEIKEYNKKKFFLLFPNPIYRELEVRLIPVIKNISLEFILRKDKQIEKIRLRCCGRNNANESQILYNENISNTFIEIKNPQKYKEISIEVYDSNNDLIDYHPFASFIGG